MAVVYLRTSDGNDSDDGSTWALAKATLLSALTTAGNSGTVFISQGHAETLTSANLALGTSFSGRINVIAVNDSAEPPTTLVTKDDAIHPKFNVSGTLAFEQWGYFYGVEFHTDGSVDPDALHIGSSSVTAHILMEECYINNTGTGLNSELRVGGFSLAAVQRVLSLLNTDLTIKTSNTSASVLVDSGGLLTIRGGKLVGTLGAAGRVLFGSTNRGDASSRLDSLGFDCSALGSTEYLYTQVESATDVNVVFRRLKTPATFNALLTQDFQSGYDAPFTLASYGSADEYSSFREDRKEGIVEDDTSIYRDNSGESFSVVLNSNTFVKEFTDPLRFKLCELVLDLTSSTTITVHILQDAGVVLQNDEIWVEIESVDATDLALGLFSSTRLASPLDTPTNLTSTAEAWTGDGGGSDTRSIAHTLSAVTGASSVPVAVWVCLAKPSTEVFACPVVEIS